MDTGKKAELNKRMMHEYIDILAEKFGISKDEEAKEILWDTVFGSEKDEVLQEEFERFILGEVKP